VVAGTAAGDFAVVRYNFDGSVDATFGSGGVVITDLGANDHGNAVAIAPNGRIVVAGSTDLSSDGESIGPASGPATYGEDDFAVVRYLQSGALDTSFDGDGIVTTDIDSGSGDQAFGVTVRPDGKVVAAGVASCVYCGDSVDFGDVAVVRYDLNGGLDTSFDGDGIVTTDLFGYYDEGQAVRTDAQGRTIVAGSGIRSGQSECSSLDAAVIRYLSDGARDTSFSGNGIAPVDLGGDEWFRGVTLDEQGRIVAAGGASPGGCQVAQPVNGQTRFLVARLLSDGSRDQSFNGSGANPGTTLTSVGLGGSEARGVVVDSAGNVIVGGTAFGGSSPGSQPPARVAPGASTPPGSNDDFALVRYLIGSSLGEGTPDPDFGPNGNGIVTTDLGGSDEAVGVGLTSGEERIVLGGSSAGDAAAARYYDATEGEPGPLPSPPPPGPDLTITKTDTPDPLTSTDEVLYTIPVTNEGPGSASPVIVTEQLPEGATFVSASSGAGTCTYDSVLNQVVCDLGSVPENGTVIVTVLVKTPFVEDLTTLTDVATVSSSGDPDSTNNRATEDTTVDPKNDQDRGTGYIPPEGGTITTDQGGGATANDPVVLTMIMGPQTGTQANPTAATGGVARLYERRCGRKSPLAPCIAKTLGDFQPPPGFTDVRGSFTYDRSVVKGRAARGITVAFQKAIGDPVLELSRCGDPRVAPCVIAVHRFKKSRDIRVRVYLGEDPRMGSH
jgi:uncharacterized delta-60 repeat protein/uncharacterized repeat protein (TIGR01451 family)